MLLLYNTGCMQRIQGDSKEREKLQILNSHL